MALYINILISLGLAFGVAAFWVRRTINHYHITTSLAYFTVGIAVLALPLAYTTDIRLPAAAWRLAGATAGLIGYFSCLQIQWERRNLLTALYTLFFLVALQAMIGAQQLLNPDEAWVPLYGNRVYGVFFQPNVFASFIATGIAIALALLLLPGFTAKRPVQEQIRQYGLLILLAGFSALLVCIQSRTGWLGGIAAMLLLVRFGNLDTSRTMSALAALAGGGILGGYWLFSDQHSLPLVDHASSNHARWTMLRDTLAMMGEKPMLGWGYGGFEYDFQHFRINQTPPTVVTEIARHPHNELLLWIVEGGLVGLAGVALMITGMGIIVRRAIRQDHLALTSRHGTAGIPTALCLALLPIAIHSMLEFPFYISALHFATFLLLLAMADRLSAEAPRWNLKSNRLRGALIALALGAAVVATFAVKGVQTLIQVERFGMEDVSPLSSLPPLSRRLLQERILFDEQVGALMTYNRTQDERLLDNYRLWAQAYLQQRIDKQVYATLIQIFRHQNRTALAERYRREAALFFPADIRFTAPPAGTDDRTDTKGGT